MNTIKALEKDIYSQVSYLKQFKPCVPVSKKTQKNSIFCGSGDSLAAAMLAQAHSDYDAKAMDPLDLLKNKNILKNNSVFIISISGKTISNVKVARLTKKSIAITSNPQSVLANACNRMIPLKFPTSDVITAGSLSFLESALTCISLVKKFKISDTEKIFQEAVRKSRKIVLGQRTFLLGNLHTFPIAMYGAAKIFEILGFDAHYERIEQFSHMELFSAKRGDSVIIFEEKNKHNLHLVKNLKKAGLNVIHPTLGSQNKISQFLFFTFFSQLLPLNLAKKQGQNDCHFVISKKIRLVSDNMIY